MLIDIAPDRCPRGVWLIDTWLWRLTRDDGRPMADGEGCRTAAEAMEVARDCARREFGEAV